MADNSKGKQTKFELVIAGVDKFSNVFKAFNDRVDTATAGLNRMQKAVTNLSRATGFSRLTGAAGNVAKNIKNVVNEGKALVGTVVGLAGKLSLLFGAAGGGLFALAKGTANAGDAAAKSASRAGVGVRTWQEYAHAASLSDVSNEQLEKGLVKIQDLAIKAFQGDKAQVSLLKRAGIDPKTAKGEVKNADSLFQELADKIRKLQDAGQGAQAVNLVKSIFGDEGTKLMPLLQGGSAGLREMRLEAHKLGLVFAKEDAKASEDFNDGLTKLLGMFKGWGYAIGNQLLPPLTKLMEKFTEWGAKQREIVAGGFAEWIEKLDVDKIWAGFERGLQGLSDLAATVDGVAQAFGGWENVLIAVAGVISGKFLLSIGGMIAAFAKLGLVVVTNPLFLQGASMFLSLAKASFFAGSGLVSVGKALMALGGAGPWILVTALTTAVYAIYKNWDGVVSYFQNLWAEVRSAFQEGWIKGILKTLWNFNPLRLILKGVNEMIAYFTGYNPFESIVKSWSDTLTGWMPDWAKDKLGISPNQTQTANTSMGAPLNLGPAARSIAESRTEHVERQENTVTLVPPPGWDMRADGGSGVRQSGTSMQIGYEAYAY